MKTRWLRFSLRTLLLLIMALCVWLGIQVNAARRQKEAVAVIEKVGATVIYDYQVLLPPAGATWLRRVVDHQQLPPGPTWLRQQIGDDYFRTVVSVFINLRLDRQKAALDELAKLPHVREFVFVDGGTGIGVSDKDFTALSEFRQLEWLTLDVARVKGTILGSLPNPGRLKLLSLNGTDADDATMKHIEKMTSLERLFLHGSHVTDAGLVHLRDLTNLEHLGLNDTNITDAGLQHLYGLKMLTLLGLRGTQVSEAGISALRAALPNAKIAWP